MRRAARTDANLTEVVAAMRRAGLSVHVDNDLVDVWAGYGGVTRLVEVRDGSKSQSRVHRYTTRQKKFREWWTGGIDLVTSVNDALILAARMKRWHAALCRDAMKGE